MGLLDNVLGSAVPGGRLAKPLGIALLALLASRAMSGGNNRTAGTGGGLGGLLSGGLGGLVGSLMGGGQPAPPQEQTNAAVSGGLGALLQRFQQSGYGDIVNSWIGTGQNQPIAPDQLHEAIGPETVDELSRPTGVPRGAVLSELSHALATVVDRFTPEGRIPNHEGMARWQAR